MQAAPNPLNRFGFVNPFILFAVVMAALMVSLGVSNYVRRTFNQFAQVSETEPSADASAMERARQFFVLSLYPKAARGAATKTQHFFMGYLSLWMLYYISVIAHMSAEV